jgi:hypothetical protein
VPTPGRIAEEHRDLAVLHPPGGAGVLPLHARTSGALFEVAGFIDHQHRIRAAQMLHHIPAHIVADRVGVPPGTRQQVLHPIRGGVPRLLGDRPAVLAPQLRH